MSGIMSLLLAARVAAGGFTEYKIFTASGNWTAPTGVTQVEYLVVAGGAGGGSSRRVPHRHRLVCYGRN
jgi:hypothetical protein